MSKIEIMDELLANKIAAGEVVERCASVVKELVENSIDAGATEIKIELKEAGTKEVKITDNGVGMDKDDAVLAFSRHATSKIKNENDLFNINTLGFRGEALASIASVSKITLKTSTGGVGTIVEINGGKIVEVKNGDARVGTLISVRDLFFNTPARLKYLKSLYTELSSITSYVNKIALSNPNIMFTLINNENTILKTDGSGNLLKVIMAIYGADVAKKMLTINGENDDYIISGYISMPEVNRSNRNHMITLVNGRVVRNLDLNKTMNDAYHTFKPDNLYPIIVLNITVDPILIDVNIHPTKQDIKFSKMEELNDLVKSLITNTLRNNLLIPKVEIKDKKLDITKEYVQQSFTLDVIKEESISYTNSSYGNVEIDIQSKSNIEIESITDNDIVEEELPEDIVGSKEEIKKTEIPHMYPIGSVHGTYIVCQNELGMYLIDQHAAKERVNYEIVLEKLSNPKKESISFLFPITLEFTNEEMIIMKENFEFLRNMGFVIDEFGINSIIIKEHPTWLPKNHEEKAIKRIIELVYTKEGKFSIEKFNDHLAADISCKMSIKGNDAISIEEMEQLIIDLRKCNNPYNCPHGRPTMIFYSKYDLEKLFKRSGF